MTDKLREAAQMALDALEDACGNRCNREYNPCLQREAAEALRAALAQPEPMLNSVHCECGASWVYQNGVLKYEPSKRGRILCGCGDQIMPDDGAECGTCVTARNATQREWVGLTDEEIEKLVYDIRSQMTGVVATAYVARAIEAKLKEKNT